MVSSHVLTLKHKAKHRYITQKLLHKQKTAISGCICIYVYKYIYTTSVCTCTRTHAHTYAHTRTHTHYRSWNKISDDAILIYCTTEEFKREKWCPSIYTESYIYSIHCLMFRFSILTRLYSHLKYLKRFSSLQGPLKIYYILECCWAELLILSFTLVQHLFLEVC